MQAQQHKPIVRQRLSVGEIVIAYLNLMLGWACARMAFIYLPHLTESRIFLLLGSAFAVTTLGSVLTGILVWQRKRLLASSAQWLASVGALGVFLSLLWWMVQDYARRFGSLLSSLTILVIALIFAWFAWFLKRMDKSE